MIATLRIASAIVLAAGLSTFVAFAQRGSSEVTAQDLQEGLKHGSRWLMYSGDYTGMRHSPLKQITPANVHRLAAQWTFQVDNMVPGRGFEGTPLMLDGVLD